jgi:hypothetical protein
VVTGVAYPRLTRNLGVAAEQATIEGSDAGLHRTEPAASSQATIKG